MARRPYCQVLWFVLGAFVVLSGSPPAFGQLIEVQSPNGGESWGRGETHEITWDHAGWTSLHVAIVLKYTETPSGTEFAIVDESSPTVNDGSYSWTIQNDTRLRTDYKIYIYIVEDSSNHDWSDSTFTVTEGGPPANYDADLTLTPSLREIDAGQTASFSLTIENTGNVTESFRVEPILPSGWTSRPTSFDFNNMIPGFRFVDWSWAIDAPADSAGGDYTVALEAIAKTPNSTVDQASATVRIRECDPPSPFDNVSPASGAPFPVSLPPEKLNWSYAGNMFSGDTYEVYLEKDVNPPSHKVGTVDQYSREWSLDGFDFSPGTWYWRIVARNSCGTREGQTWSFILSGNATQQGNWLIRRRDLPDGFDFHGTIAYSIDIDQLNGQFDLTIRNRTQLWRLVTVSATYLDGPQTLIEAAPRIPLGDRAAFDRAMQENNVLPAEGPDGFIEVSDIPLQDLLNVTVLVFTVTQRHVFEHLVAAYESNNRGDSDRVAIELGQAIARNKAVTGFNMGLGSDLVQGAVNVVGFKVKIVKTAYGVASVGAGWAGAFFDWVENGGIDPNEIVETSIKTITLWGETDGGSQIIGSLIGQAASSVKEFFRALGDILSAIDLGSTLIGAFDRLYDVLTVPDFDTLNLEVSRQEASLAITQFPSFYRLNVGDSHFFGLTVRNDGNVTLTNIYPTMHIVADDVEWGGDVPPDGVWAWPRVEELSGAYDVPESIRFEATVNSSGDEVDGGVVSRLGQGNYAQFNMRYVFDAANNWPLYVDGNLSPFSYRPGRYHYELEVPYIWNNQFYRPATIYYDFIIDYPNGTVPRTPQNLSLTAGGGYITLVWDSVPDKDVEEYRIYERAVSKQAGEVVARVEAPADVSVVSAPSATTEYAVAAYAPGRGESNMATIVYTPEAEGIIGDVNGDGAVNSKDARLVFFYTVLESVEDVNLEIVNAGAHAYWGTLQPNIDLLGDVNADGGVDPRDARLIFFYYVLGSVDDVNQEILNVGAQGYWGTLQPLG